MCDLVKALEGDEEELYDAQSLARGRGDRRRRARARRDLATSSTASGRAGGPTTDRATALADRAVAARRAQPTIAPGASAGTERGRSGTLRAVIFGVSDGLV